MKTIVLTLATILGTAFMGFSQTKSSIAAANPGINGLHITPKIASKLIRLELIKLNSYSVYDEFDMQEVYEAEPTLENDCLSKTCLETLGKALKVDYVISGSYDVLGNKIVISLKIIDVANGTIFKSSVREFDNQEVELQRMTEIVLKEMHGLEVDKVLVDKLKFNNELITTDNVGKVKNSGPRVGFAALTGSLNEFATRSIDQGGLDIFPAMSMIGYQIEGQYVGTENFSALVEGIFNISGMEQLQFLPSISILNGFRFGKGSWEFAFGPGFNLSKTSEGFFDADGTFGEKGSYYSTSDWNTFATKEYNDETLYPEFFTNGIFARPTVEDVSRYKMEKGNFDKRGKVSISTQFIIAAGRTFRSGALNIPVNVFYSSKGDGGMIGLSVGFNIMKSKETINPKKTI